MQIMPDVFMERMEENSSASWSVSPSQARFADELHKSFQQDGNDPWRDAERDALSEFDENDYANAWQAHAPYNPAPESFSPFAPQEVRFSTKEVEKLIESMGKDEVSPHALAALRDMGNLPGGATAAQLIRAAQDALNIKGGKLSKVDEEQLLSLLRKSTAGQDGKNVFDQGTSLKGLESFLGGLDGEASITVTRGEMTALLKTLGVSEQTGKNILAAFGNENALTTTGQGLATLLDTAHKELDMAQASLSKLLNSLEKHMPGVLKDAEKREEMERMSAMREDRSVAQTRALIQDKATQAAPGRDDEPDQNKQTRTVSRKPEQNEAKPGTAENAASQSVRNNTGDVNNTAGQSNAQTNSQAHAQQQGAHGSPMEDHTQNRQGTGQGGNGFGFGAPGNERDEKRASAKTSSSTSGGALFASVTQGVGTVQPSTHAAQAQGTSPLPSALSSQAMEQIEQAALSARKNGTQRLEVALAPSELGAMTVVLTSRHGEISAVLRPDRAETAALLNQQVEQIRQQLEHQGFKVEKVDVQTQLSDQNGQHWQGMDQHNSSREFSARAEEMLRLRRMGRSAPGMGNTVDAAMARDMQLQARSASVAGHGLHIVT